jgi:hypothetical protein
MKILLADFRTFEEIQVEISLELRIGIGRLAS